jgi:hypothetical protein
MITDGDGPRCSAYSATALSSGCGLYRVESPVSAMRADASTDDGPSLSPISSRSRHRSSWVVLKGSSAF